MTTSAIMERDQFWSLIAQTLPHQADQDRQLSAFQQALAELSADEIEAFERAFQAEQFRSYTWNLWGAASVLHGGCSDDGFEYFQRWLISKGRKTFEAPVDQPDDLADLLGPGDAEPCEFEEFATVAGKVWFEKTGINPWQDADAEFPYTGAPPAPEPSGEMFDEDQVALAKQYPKLWARFGNSPLG